ncbi:MAG TPA: type II toxin-antitoxin system RelE/ParE family toxin [Rhizomicrobium sp.]|jgi:plasmid stabilization system protein ParE
MTVVFTAAANADLDNILAYTKQNFPNQLPHLEARMREVIAGIERRPLSTRAVSQRLGVRVVPLLRFPFVIFYRQIDAGIEILHIQHVAQQTGH